MPDPFDPHGISPRVERLGHLVADPVVQLLAKVAAPVICHLVGGVVRDFHLGRIRRDWDVVVESNGASIARRMARSLEARVISIGGRRFPAFRLVKDNLTLDLWDREGVDLESDLERRDFTVNSIAVDVVTGTISDPFLGLADLERRLLRATTPATFSHDPLRVLRLVRLQAELDGFAIQPATAAAARREVSSLDEIAPERIRAELDLILRASRTAATLARLQDLHIYPGLWLPEHPWKASSQDLGEPANRLAGFVEDLSSLTVSGEPVVDLQLARQTLLFAFLPLDTLRQRLHALRSMKEAGYVTKSSASKLQTLLEQEELPVSQREWRWFLHRTGDLWPTALAALSAVAGVAAHQRERLAVKALKLARTSGDEIFDPRPLLSGHDLQHLLKIPKGPLLGQIASKLKRLQVEGQVRTRNQALAYLRNSATSISNRTP